jgi:hypothetical protein
MRTCLRVLLIAAFAAAPPVLCYSEQPASDEAEANARLLERWRTDPEHYARLQADFRAFTQLPAEKQERLRQLDQELHNTDSITQKRLWSVMERYTAWYDHLSEADQRKIDQATDRQVRLLIVKQYRENQWMTRQPQKVRDELGKLAPDKRGEEIAKQRRDERQRLTAWMRTMHVGKAAAPPQPTKPVRASDFPADATQFINEMLKPQLIPSDRDHLKALEGKWPHYARRVLELSEQGDYRVKLPGPSTGPATFEKLPDQYKDLFQKSAENLPTTVRRKATHWPEFAIAVTEEARKKNATVPPEKKATLPLGPAQPKNFATPVKEFIETTLTAQLSDAEKKELKDTEGRWPEYPQKVLALAEKYYLDVPMMRMPYDVEWWEKVGEALPEVPDRVLHDFALNDLTADERAKLELSVSDPTSRDRLVQEYFKKNPNEKKRLERLDRQMLLDGGKPPKTKPGL